MPISTRLSYLFPSTIFISTINCVMFHPCCLVGLTVYFLFLINMSRTKTNESKYNNNHYISKEKY